MPGVAREDTLADGIKSIFWVESLLVSSVVAVSDDVDGPGVTERVEVSGCKSFLAKVFLGSVYGAVAVSPKIALLVFCFLASDLVSRPVDWPDMMN